jgi:hypothetical protein
MITITFSVHVIVSIEVHLEISYEKLKKMRTTA